MNYSNELLIAIVSAGIGLSGVLIGAYMTFRLRRDLDRQRSLNLALYHFLQIHRYAEFYLQTNPQKVVERAVELMLSDLNLEPKLIEEGKERHRHLFPLVEGRFKEELETMDVCTVQQTLQLALDELAKHEPILGFSIKQRSTWEKSLQLSAGYVDRVADELAASDLLTPHFGPFGTQQMDKLRQEMIQDIRCDLLSISKCLGLRKYLGMRRYIKNMKVLASTEKQAQLLSADMAPGIRVMLQAMAAAAKKTTDDPSQDVSPETT